MKRHFYLFFAVVALLAVSLTGCENGDNGGGSKSVFDIKSPYEGVNWSSFGQFKAALHTHTTNSDGSASLPDAVTAHYTQGYDILATTDHVWKRLPGATTELYKNFITTDYMQTSYNGADLSALTAERIAELDAGAGRENRPMLLVPYSAELAIGGDPTPDEANVFFWGAGKNPIPVVPMAWDRNIDTGLADANNSGGIFFINHPGRSTNAMNFGGTLGQGADLPNNPSNMATWVRRYVNLYLKYPANTLVGMEIFNRRDQDSRHDRVLWDNILKTTIPEGRSFWGYANDDSHSTGAVGINYNVMVMPSNSLDNFRSAMIEGRSYMVTCVAWNEGIGSGTTSNAPITTHDARPRITSVTVDKTAETITIVAENATKIEWISDGKLILTSDITESGTGTINLLDSAINPQVGSYVRANIAGTAGIALIQPIVTKRN